MLAVRHEDHEGGGSFFRDLGRFGLFSKRVLLRTSLVCRMFTVYSTP